MPRNDLYPEYHAVCITCGNEKVLRERQAKTGNVVIRCERCGTRFTLRFDRRTFRKRPFPAVRFGPSSSDSALLPFDGELLDVSAGGARIATKASPPERGTKIQILFALPPRGSRVLVWGDVVWIRLNDTGRHEFGISISSASERAMKTITAYLDD